MSLKSTRKFLCVVLILIMAAGGCFLTGTLTVKATLCSEKYMQRYFTSQKVMDECRKNFEKRIEALADKSGIPVRAFEAVSNFSEIKSDNPVRRLYSGNDTTLYTKNTVEKMEQLCIEYLEGNSIKYDKALVRNTADEAARIYADCFGLKNTEKMAGYLDEMNNSFRSNVSVASLMVAFPLLLLIILFKKQRDAFSTFLSSLTACGLTLVIVGIVGIILGMSNDFMLYPFVYAQTMQTVVNSVFLILMSIGAFFAVASIFANVSLFKSQEKKNSYD